MTFTDKEFMHRLNALTKAILALLPEKQEKQLR